MWEGRRIEGMRGGEWWGGRGEGGKKNKMFVGWVRLF